MGEPVRPPKGVPALQQSNNGTVITVSTVHSETPDDHCWFNAVKYSNLHTEWKPVFGWALWELPNGKFVAQHHAVVGDGKSYLDVTLSKSFESITFLVDDRAPFDFENFRTPFNFEFQPQGSIWHAPGKSVSQYSIAALDPPDDQVLEEIRHAKERGVI
jgi:hypothetical protein